MTAQEDLKATFQKIVKNAEANCPACRETAFWRQSDPTTIITHASGIFHTCDATIDAAAEAMLAAATAIGHNPRYPLTEQGIEDSLAGKHDEQTCSACQVEATIKRLREEAK